MLNSDLEKRINRTRALHGQLQERLSAVSIKLASADGHVHLEADGHGTLLRLSIDPAALAPIRLDGLERELVSLILQARRRADETTDELTNEIFGEEEIDV